MTSEERETQRKDLARRFEDWAELGEELQREAGQLGLEHYIMCFSDGGVIVNLYQEEVTTYLHRKKDV